MCAEEENVAADESDVEVGVLLEGGADEEEASLARVEHDCVREAEGGHELEHPPQDVAHFLSRVDDLQDEDHDRADARENEVQEDRDRLRDVLGREQERGHVRERDHAHRVQQEHHPGVAPAQIVSIDETNDNGRWDYPLEDIED